MYLYKFLFLKLDGMLKIYDLKDYSKIIYLKCKNRVTIHCMLYFLAHAFSKRASANSLKISILQILKLIVKT